MSSLPVRLPGFDKRWWASQSKRPPAIRRHFLSRRAQWHQDPSTWAAGLLAYETAEDGTFGLVAAWPDSVERIVLDRLEPEDGDRAGGMVRSILDAGILSPQERRVLALVPQHSTQEIARKIRRSPDHVRPVLNRIGKKVRARPDLMPDDFRARGEKMRKKERKR